MRPCNKNNCKRILICWREHCDSGSVSGAGMRNGIIGCVRVKIRRDCSAARLGIYQMCKCVCTDMVGISNRRSSSICGSGLFYGSGK